MTAAPSETRRIWLGGAVLVVAGLAAYHNSSTGPFIFDDVPAIVANPSIEHWRTALVPRASATVSGRPILNLSFALNYVLSGRNVWSYHALNLVIHLLAGLTWYGIARRAFARLFPTGTLLPAFLVALCWTVHPLQTESVTYVVQRAESLMGLFYLLTLYAFQRWTEGAWPAAEAKERRGGWAVLSVVFCLLGMASKEVMVSAPVLVLLYDRAFVSGSFRAALGRRRGYYAALGATWIVLGFLAVANGNRGGTSGFNVGVPWMAYAETQFPAVLRYLKLSFWPHPLVLDYGTQWVTQPASILPAAAWVLGLLAATVYALRPVPGGAKGSRLRPALGFAGAWFFAILAPTSFVPGTRQTSAEHRMYLALAPVLAVAILALWRALSRLGEREKAAPVGTWIFGAAGLAAAVGLGFATARRNEAYRTEQGIWSDTVAKVPENFYAWNNLGDTYLREGRVAEGMACYEKALSLHPDFAEAQNNIGVALRRSNRAADAVPHFEAALRIKPDFVAVETNLGDALVALGRIPEALTHLERAWRTDPGPIESFNLGDGLALAGRLPEALERYQQSLRLNPNYVEARVHYGVALTRLGRLSEATAQFHAALAQQPDQFEAHYNLAMILLESGQAAKAVPEFEAVLKVRPDSAEAQGNFGNALRSLGRLDEALPPLREAVRLNPAGAQGQYNLGVALAAAGQLPEAIAAYREAVRLQPNFPDARDNLGVALAKSNRLPEAVAEFERALQAKPDFPAAERNLGRALQAEGQGAEAAVHLAAADRLETAAGAKP